MADIIPIRGLRYTLKELSNLVTPPYDVIDEEAQERYYQLHPCNIIRLEYGKILPSDNENSNRYTRAASFFNSWQEDGILAREKTPAFYRYEQKFTCNGETKIRSGFICGVKLEPYEKGVVLPHEETLPKHKADRLALMRACRANFSPIFGLFADEQKNIDLLLANDCHRPPDVCFTDENGHQHSMWVITSPKIIEKVQQEMANKRIFIADGHHRYETALNYKNERLREEGPSDGEHLYSYVMMTLVNLYDPGLVILPTHRLIRNVRNLNLESFLDEIRKNFYIKNFSLSNNRDNFKNFLKVLKNNVQAGNRKHAFGLYCGNGQLYLLTLKDESDLPGLMKTKYSPAWQKLDVSVLHCLILDELLGIGSKEMASGNFISYTRDEEGVLDAVDSSQYQLAFLLNSTLVDEVIAIAKSGEKMPQKSTYFYPKLITGLVINSLE